MPRAEALAGVARRRNRERGLGTGSGDGLHEAATVEGAQRDGEPVGLAGKQVRQAVRGKGGGGEEGRGGGAGASRQSDVAARLQE